MPNPFRHIQRASAWLRRRSHERDAARIPKPPKALAPHVRELSQWLDDPPKLTRETLPGGQFDYFGKRAAFPIELFKRVASSKHPSTVPVLLKAVHHFENAEHAQPNVAIAALGQINHPAATYALAKTAGMRADRFSPKKIRGQALAELSTRQHSFQDALPHLHADLTRAIKLHSEEKLDAQRQFQILANTAAFLGEPGARALLEWLADPAFKGRAQAAQAARHAPTAPIVDALVQALFVKDENVQNEAAVTLVELAQTKGAHRTHALLKRLERALPFIYLQPDELTRGGRLDDPIEDHPPNLNFRVPWQRALDFAFLHGLLGKHHAEFEKTSELKRFQNWRQRVYRLTATPNVKLAAARALNDPHQRARFRRKNNFELFLKQLAGQHDQRFKT